MPLTLRREGEESRLLPVGTKVSFAQRGAPVFYTNSA